MSAASPHATTTAAPSCPWGNLTTTDRDVRSSPKLQEILDEELARQMNEIELQTATAALLKSEETQEDVSVYADYFTDEDVEETVAEDQGGDEEEEEEEEDDEPEDFDTYDAYDEVDEDFLAKGHSTRGMGSRRRGAEASQKLQLTGSFDDRTKFVLGKLAARGILSAVHSRLHSSMTSTIHLSKNEVTVTTDGVDETVLMHYAVKILKFSTADRSQKTSESLQRSGRPVNEEMMWMSIRRQLKIQMDREHAALVRAVGCGVRAPAPVCSWEHVLVSAFIGDETKAAPRLRDVVLRPGQLAQSYVDLLGAMRAMYQQAKLVHGGLNEFSILYHNDACWITDFSSAIDTVHAEHIEALALDVDSIHNFFSNSGLPKASKHSVGLLHAATMQELITEPTPGKVLGAYPWLKPYLYQKK